MIAELLEKQYHSDNYKIVKNDTNNGLAYIYCSSNALYMKDDEKSFVTKVVEGDRYEWTSLSAEVKPELEIFIRDIWLSWYVKGINSQVNTYGKLIQFLREKTEGFTVRCVGASSGGFIGSILALELNADLVYSFAGQFSLEHHFDHLCTNPHLKKWKEEYGNYWFEYYKRIPESNTSILYVYPNQSVQDQEQYDLVRNMDQVTTLEVVTGEHGVAVFPFAVPILISYDIVDVQKMSKKRTSSKLMTSIRIAGIVRFVAWAIRKINKR